MVETLLSRGVGSAADNHSAGLDRETASAEEIIADLRASRVEREQSRLACTTQPHTDPGLSTLDPHTGRPYVSSGELRGIGTGDNPPPSDEDIERWRMEKYDE